MTRKIIAILLLLVLLIPLFTITSEAVYNVTIGNGSISPSIQSPSGGNYTNGGTDAFIIRYKKVATFLGGLATIAMVGAMLYNIARLNLTMGNPMQRQQCLRGILVCGVFAGLLGSATLFIGLFYGALK
jgi:hypothetical protein